MRAKNSYIIYFLTRSLFLGFGLSLLFNSSGKDTYFGIILGMFIGLIFTNIYAYLIKKKESQDLKDIFKKHKTIGFITRILFLIASIIIATYVLVIYKIFVVSFLLISSPELFVTIPFVILTTYCAFKGLKVIKRVSGSLLTISVIFCAIILFSLTGFMETTNLLPVLSTNPGNILKTALMFGGISSLPNILALHFKGDVKGITKMYVFASLLLALAALSVEGVFGEIMVRVFRFPEYMVLKQIKLFQFIEKMENVLSLVWLLDLFVTMIMCIYSIKELLPEKQNKLTTILTLIIMIYIIDNVFAFDYVNELRLYSVLPYLSIIIPIIIILLFLYLLKKPKTE